ncbi:hypothetical protein OG864_01960 [Streptomyces sp. NBC_00124]|uniref:hypothetical protein n=1 Tax=Streptomyces sp. NBC_00124 TaxID=2975662 RepID=UPI0022572522|nr:hypothetical protein [Streptomyces sp. NBC_00124]MCX5357522.1 hypothetical protein [Streptomyces sp. NBC_00124]
MTISLSPARTARPFANPDAQQRDLLDAIAAAGTEPDQAPSVPLLHRTPLRQGDAMRKAVLGLFVALAAVLAVTPLASADQTQTVACCGGTPIPP